MIDYENETEVAKLKELEDFLLSIDAPRNTWGALIRNEEGELQLWKAAARPCYGEIRRYADGTRPDDPHPGDLPRPIPKGTREAFGVRLYRYSDDASTHNRITECMFGPESPWRRGLGKEVTLVDKKGMHAVALLTDTEFDPTVLSNLLILQRNLSYMTKQRQTVGDLMDKIGIPEALFVMCFYRTDCGASGDFASYYMQAKSSLSRYLKGEAVDLSRGGTWRDQEDYNRPQVSEIFYDPEAEPFFVRLRKGETSSLSVDELVKRFNEIKQVEMKEIQA